MQFPLELTQGNVKRLLNGHQIQLTNDQLKKDKHYIVVHPSTHKKLNKAKASGKGVRLIMTPEEFKASGSGFMDILRGIKKGAAWIKNNVIDSSLYQSTVKPAVRGLVNAAETAIMPIVPGPLQGAVHAAVEKVGSVTNAYGLPANKVVKQRKQVIKAKPRAKKVGGSFINL